uniref:Ig-like domain-containing protein n=1 Tax=Leptobrachium leishanense TaxID=445787 RepID=A0A8C5WI76_9ANUR
MDKQESREFSVKDFPWPPQIEDIEVVKSPSSSTVKLTCKIHSFFPDLLTVKWIEKKTDGQEVDVINNNKYVISNTSSKADGKHTLSCNVSLSFEKSHDSEDKVEYVCRVEHPCLKSPIQSRTGLLQLEDLHSFIVHNIQGPQTWVVGEKVTLYCAASNCKKDVSVLWILKEGDGTPQEVSELPPEKHEMIPPAEYTAVRDNTEKSDIEELLNITSSLSFVPSITKHRNLTLSCKLSSEGKTKEKSFQLKHLYAKPQFLEPAEFTICSPGEVQLGINLRKFYPETIDITWSCNKGKSPDTKIPEYTVNYDKTCNTKSEQRFHVDLFKDLDFRVNVSWKHESMDKQESREFSVKDFPWPPQIEDIEVVKTPSSSTVKLTCKIHSFFPDLLTVKWIEKKTDGQEVDVINNNKYVISNTSSKADGKHTLSCNASLSFEKSHDSEDKVEYVCLVEHPCLKSPIQSRTGLLQLEDLHSFIVHNIQGPQTWVVGEKVTLYCAASNCKKDVSVLWILKEGDGTPQEVSELPPEKHETIPPAEYTAVRDKTEKSDIEELLNITSSLSFVPSITKHRNLTLSCKLSSEGKTKEKSFQLKHLHVKPKASDPIKLALLDSGEVAGTFNILEFYPKDIQIIWTGGVNSASELRSTEQITEHGYTHDVHSECRIDGLLFKNPDYTVKVSWKHESMDSWESRQISVRDKDYPWRPEIQNIPVPGIISNRPTRLECKISNFFPDNVTAKWLRKEKDSKELFPLNHGEKYKVPVLKPEKQSENTFTCTASLNFTPSLETDQGADFICVVEHPSLGSAVEKKTGALQVTDFLWRPRIEEIITPHIVIGRKVTIKCKISDCIPGAVTVYWLAKEKRSGRLIPLSNSETYITSQITWKRENQNSFYGTSRLTFTSSLQTADILEFICRVEHAECQPIEKGTGPINVTQNHMRSEAENLNHLNVHSVKRSLTVDDNDRIAGSFSKKKVRADMTGDQVDEEMEIAEENPTDKEVSDMDLSCTIR